MSAATLGVLVVDGEDPVRRSTVRALAKAGYDVRDAATAGEALAALAGAGRGCRLLLTDLWVGAMSGAELAEIARRLRPGLSVVFMTADPSLFAAASRPAAGVLTKPFSEDELLAAVAFALREASDGG
ncbi:MAG: response regulator [Elusimicrobia bacterium]|nr:response regulator [Elusimicrobiota bacterium]